jgi:hypothetical protein
MRSSSAASRSSESLRPPAPKTLRPLSIHGLWLAETTRPAAAARARIATGSPAVGMRPRSSTRAPPSSSPPATEATISGPDSRVSRAMSTSPPAPACSPSARPSASSQPGSSGAWPARPRTPSVPNQRRRAAPPAAGWVTCFSAVPGAASVSRSYSIVRSRLPLASVTRTVSGRPTLANLTDPVAEPLKVGGTMLQSKTSTMLASKSSSVRPLSSGGGPQTLTSIDLGKLLALCGGWRSSSASALR